MKVTPFETYQTYLSVKNHFSNPKYDYFKYGGRSRAKIAAFNKRKDKYWFEKTSRKYSDGEIVDFLLANFVTTDNPKNLWIGEIINSGERTYADWMRRKQSISYLFKEESEKLLDENFDLFIILDDIHASESNIGTIKNLLSHKIAIFTNFEDDQETNEIMLKLGFQTELIDKNNKLKCFSYNLKTYNNKRTWNNPKGWANPENFDKFRW